MRYILLILIFFLLPTAAFAKTVVATGYGGSVSTAEKDALRNAIESAVGVRVDSKTLTENYALVKDRVFTSSEGFVTSFEKISQTRENGMYIVTVRADVREDVYGNIISDKKKRAMIKSELLDPPICVAVMGENAAIAENALTDGLRKIGFTRIVSRREKADFLLTAAVTVNKTGMTGGVFTVNLKVTNQKTGEIIFNGSESVRGAGAVGRNSAVKRACGKLLDKIDFEVMKRAAGMKTHITVILSGQNSLTLTEQSSLLADIPGVLKVYPRRYKNNITEFDIDYFGNIEDFATALEQKNLRIKELGRDYIRL